MLTQTLRRRARQAGVPSAFTHDEWIALCDRFGNVCVACGAADPLTVDHVIPLSKGGANRAENIQPLCFPCNNQKGAAIIDYRPKA
jgi:5-methylcytosine-specific restriction endonuclease McrA